MALDSSTYYSNSLVGVPQIGADVNVYDTHSTPKFAAGVGFQRADGNIFRYCHVGTATNAGKLVGPTTASGGATYQGAKIITPTSAVQVAAEAPLYPGQVGSHYVEATISGIAADKYLGSYIVVTQGTGLGFTYRIVGNTATDNPATGNVRIQLYEAIKTAFTSSTGFIIVPSMFTDLVATTTTSAQVTGVLMSTTTSTNLWAWVCTRGVVGCTEDATANVITGTAVTAGQQVTCSENTAGSYEAVNSITTQLAENFTAPIVGYVITPAGATGRLGTIYLQLE